MFLPVDSHPNFPKLEEEILAFWEREKIFEKSLEKTKKGKPYTFYDGPPFATGLPHYGHILASTIKDLIPRYQTMKGRYVRRRWGWDCHGLPIEEIVERELKISGKKQIEKIGIKKFNQTCRSMVLQYVAEWRKMVRRIARWIDFDNSYKTMDRDYMESVWWAFKQIYDKGLVYEGRKVLLYCPRCETPISNFEVAMDNSYQDVTEEAVTVKFKIRARERKSQRTEEPEVYKFISSSVPTFLLAWTTTPWTLLGNVALAVGEKITYVIFKFKSQNSKLESYIIAKDRLSEIKEPYEIIKEIKGKELVGLEYEPLFDVKGIKGSKGIERAFKVYAADFVTTEEGMGVVHTAVVYGEEDYELGQKVGLPVVPLLDEKGKFNELSPELIRGQYFKDAEKIIKDDLTSRGLLFEKKMHQHSYPHCWRCDTVLFYNAIPAWFVKISNIKNQILKSNKKEISWYPEHLKLGRYAKSVESAPDWNISRNRYWGNPMPVWKCSQCDKVIVIGSVAELEKKLKNVSTKEPKNKKSLSFSVHEFIRSLDLHRPYVDEVLLKCEHCGSDAKRITEIFDSWFEAGSMPFAEFHYPFENKEVFESRLPAQFIAEYIAQTRAWFYVMHVISLIIFGKAPFENVLTTGTIMAEDWTKLSKSKRNFPDPWEVIEKYGVDSLRFYLMNSVVMQGDNMNFSLRDLENVTRKVFRILWNIYNYFVTYANVAKWHFDPKKSPNITKKSKNIMDQWINARLKQTVAQVTKTLDAYDTVEATRYLESFLNDLSTWYLRRNRGRADEAFFATLYRSLIYFSKILAPFAPYISEAIYQNLNHPDFPASVHLCDWPDKGELSQSDNEIISQMSELRRIVEEAHALRAKAGVKLRQKLPRLTIPRDLSSFLSPRKGRGVFLSYPPLERGGKKGEVESALLEILKSEVNVAEVMLGDKLELDTTLTPELRLEGLVRELERQIQAMRKESGLKIGEVVDLEFSTESDMIKKAMKMVDRKKIYVREISNLKSQISKVPNVKEIEVEGEKISIFLKISNS